VCGCASQLVSERTAARLVVFVGSRTKSRAQSCRACAAAFRHQARSSALLTSVAMSGGLLQHAVEHFGMPCACVLRDQPMAASTTCCNPGLFQVLYMNCLLHASLLAVVGLGVWPS
jgi:hypothetical protein